MLLLNSPAFSVGSELVEACRWSSRRRAVAIFAHSVIESWVHKNFNGVNQLGAHWTSKRFYWTKRLYRNSPEHGRRGGCAGREDGGDLDFWCRELELTEEKVRYSPMAHCDGNGIQRGSPIREIGEGRHGGAAVARFQPRFGGFRS